LLSNGQTIEELTKVNKVLIDKADDVEIQKIWKIMDKYCLYTDLKELYAKVMPAI
jgi:hypothetical protein